MKTFSGKKDIEGNLLLGGHLKYISNFMTLEETIELSNELLQNVKWTKGVYNMYGKSIETPRLLSSMYDKDITQSGSIWNKETEWIKIGHQWTPLMKKIKKRIEKEIGKTILYAQMNHYRNSEDYIGYHTDSEVGVNDVVASISLGSTRRFLLRDKKLKSGNANYNINLQNGSLLLFDHLAAKGSYKHSVPKLKKSDQFGHEYPYGRINITFRTNE
jgi:alkylated DNA repair dioxygenase AlkB